MPSKIRTCASALVLLALTQLALAPSASAGGKGEEWVKGVAVTTDWKKAIKSARESGKMLFIYNGWKRGGI